MNSFFIYPQWKHFGQDFNLFLYDAVEISIYYSYKEMPW